MKNTQSKNDALSQADAIIVLLAELVRQLSPDKESAQAAREKAAAVLISCGMSQERSSKLIGMKRSTAADAAKTLKI